MEDRSTIVPGAASTQPAPEQPAAQVIRPAQNQPQNIDSTPQPTTSLPSTPPTQTQTATSPIPQPASHFPKLIIIMLAVVNILIIAYIAFMLLSR